MFLFCVCRAPPPPSREMARPDDDQEGGTGVAQRPLRMRIKATPLEIKAVSSLFSCLAFPASVLGPSEAQESNMMCVWTERAFEGNEKESDHGMLHTDQIYSVTFANMESSAQSSFRSFVSRWNGRARTGPSPLSNLYASKWLRTSLLLSAPSAMPVAWCRDLHTPPLHCPSSVACFLPTKWLDRGHRDHICAMFQETPLSSPLV